MASKTRADLLKRLDPYWKMEAANVLFVPLFVVAVSQARLGWITLALTLVGCVSALAGWLVPGWAVGMADRYAATGCAVLAVLEYVNYYHRQLQHFDNREDFRRLLAGKGFRKSWLARDLEELT